MSEAASPSTGAGRGAALLATLDRWWFTPAPAMRLAVVRVAIVGFSLCLMIGLSPIVFANLRFPAERFEPIGVISVFSSPPQPALIVAAFVATLVFGIAALLGWRFRITGPAFALSMLVVTTYRNSWGMIFHSENLVVIHAMILAILPASDAWSLDARRRDAAPPTELSPAYGWGLRLMAVVTVIAYVIAGVAKLRNAGSVWLTGDVLLTHVAWDNLRKVELGDRHSPLGAWLSGHPWVFGPLAWLSMVLELGAPIALLHKRAAWAWTLGIWGFHVGIIAIMWILFPYPVSGLAFVSLFDVEEPARRLAAWARGRWPDSRLTGLLPREDGR